MADEGESIAIPLVEDRVTFKRKVETGRVRVRTDADKRLVLTQEIRLHRKTVKERHEVPVTLQVQRATVERQEKSGTTTTTTE